MKSLAGTSVTKYILALFIIAPTWANSALLETDWEGASTGNLNILYDTTTQFEWLDLSVTIDMSWDDVQIVTSSGNWLDGFRYATQGEISALWTEAGFSQHPYGTGPGGGIYTQVTESEYLASLNFKNMISGSAFNSSMQGIYGPLNTDPYDSPVRLADLTWWTDGTVFTMGTYFFDGTQESDARIYRGSYLIRETSVVPIPAAAWLFSSGLIGLIGVARRKKA